MWLVQVTVNDAECIFSVNPNISYMKLVSALSSGAAIRAAAIYCHKKMLAYPGAHFAYATKSVQPYYYPIRVSFAAEPKDVCYRHKM